MDYRPINEKIKDSRLMVIDETGGKLGVLERNQAINLAKERGYDLVLFVPAEKANGTAIAKIIDYGKFLYGEKMKEKMSRKNQTIIKTKEVKVRPQISEHDLKWRADQAKSWLIDGSQVRFKIQAYGRIGYKPELIQETFEKFMTLISPEGKALSELKRLSPVLYETTIVRNK